MSKRETVLVIILLVLIAGVAYYFFFLRPFLDSYDQAGVTLDERRNEITVAETRQELYEANRLEYENALLDLEATRKEYELKAAERDSYAAEWREYEKAVPTDFNQPVSLYDLQNIIYRHTLEVSVAYSELENPAPVVAEGEVVTGEEEPEEIVMPDIDYTRTVGVSLNFTVSYDALIEILDGIENLEHDNRTITYSYSRSDGAGDTEYSVNLYAEFLLLKPEAIYHANDSNP